MPLQKVLTFDDKKKTTEKAEKRGKGRKNAGNGYFFEFDGPEFEFEPSNTMQTTTD